MGQGRIMDSQKLEKEVELGRKAQQSADAFMNEFFGQQEDDLFNQLLDADTSDIPVIVNAKIGLDILADIRHKLDTVISTGRLAAQQLNKIGTH